MNAYLQSISGLALPTTAQTAAFARHVIGAHSWYKHLPLLPPAAQFTFFLDPHAGMRLVYHRDRYEPRPILDGSECYHYADYLTADYRERFGMWNYHVSNPHNTLRNSQPEILGPDGDRVPLPEDLIEACSCPVLASVRFDGLRNPLRTRHLSHRDPDLLDRFLAHAAQHPNDPEVQLYRAVVELWRRVLDRGEESLDADERTYLEEFQVEEPGRQQDTILTTLAVSRDCLASLIGATGQPSS